MKRYLSIDILRGLAIILMIQVHFVENLSPRESSSAVLYDISMRLGSFSAPFFSFVSGLSYFLWVRKQESLRCKDKEITRITLRRGLFLFGLGIAFNFCIWLPQDTFNWDILTLIGTSLLFLAYARKLPAPVLPLICVVIVLVSPVLRTVGEYSSYWEDLVYVYDFTFHDIIWGFAANGYFPVFPWIIFPIMGFFSGDLVFRKRRQPDFARWRLGASGLGLIGLSGIDIAFGSKLPFWIGRYYATGDSEYPASTEHVLGMLGFILLSLVLLHAWMDQKEDVPSEGGLIGEINRFSYFSLSIYVFHHMVMLWPLWIYGAWTNPDDSTIYWREAMTTPMAFTLAVIFLVVCHYVLIFLERYKKYSLESLMRRICE